MAAGEGLPLGAGDSEDLGGAPSGSGRPRNRCIDAELDEHPGERRDVDPASRRMQIEVTCGELGELGEASRDGQPRDRVLTKIFQCAADEIAHIDQGVW